MATSMADGVGAGGAETGGRFPVWRAGCGALKKLSTHRYTGPASDGDVTLGRATPACALPAPRPGPDCHVCTMLL